MTKKLQDYFNYAEIGTCAKLLYRFQNVLFGKA